MRTQDRLRAYLLVLADLCALNVALWLALLVRHLRLPDLGFIGQHLPGFNVLFCSWLFGFYAVGLYEVRRLRELPRLIRSVLGAFVVNGVWGIFFFYFFYPYSFVGMTPKTHYVLALVFGSVGVVLVRRLALRVFDLRQLRQAVAFLGTPGSVRELKAELARNPHVGFRPVDWALERADVVVIEARWLDDHWQAAQPVVREIVRRRIPVVSLSEFYESVLGKIPLEAAAQPNWLMHAVLSRNAYWYRSWKRLVDLVLAALLLAVLGPLMAVLAALVWALDGRPVFFRQHRVGLLGADFRLIKFRTLRVGAEKDGPFAQDARTSALSTRSGRWLRRCRLDELPQLLNVLGGSMSLVGPRPEWTREIAVLERKIPLYHLRHLVRPGMTGWAQLQFRATHSPSDSLEKFRFDLYYVKHLSLDLDLTILLRTFRRLFIRDASVGRAMVREFRVPKRFEPYAAGVAGLLGRRRPA